MNALYLRRASKVYVRESSNSLPESYIAPIQKNIASLGFILSANAMDRLRTLPVERLETFYHQLIKDLRIMVGAHREFRPMYPDFPDQVMQMSEASLYINAIIHYLTNKLVPYPKAERSVFDEDTELKVIELGSMEDFESIFTRLAASRTSISGQDREDVGWFISQYRDGIARLLPPRLPMKENLAIIAGHMIRRCTIWAPFVEEHFKTATDVLRLAAAMCNGDVSLAEPTKFTSFHRRERKILLSLMDRSPSCIEDMLRWPERWKRLGEYLHPGDYAEKFPRAHEGFAAVRSSEPYLTTNRKAERQIIARDISGALATLAKRPGDMARRLDHLLRLGGGDSVVEAFGKVADQVSTPVLLQVLTHFTYRDTPFTLRAFFPKGDVAKVYATPNKLSDLPAGLAGRIATLCHSTLVKRFAVRPPLGKCYLDAALSQYFAPFSQRSASKALRTLVRGSRLPLPPCKFLRFFIWWRNGTGRTDLDLSAVLCDADFRFMGVLSYYNLKDFGGCHSGDIVDAPQGAAEFIDVNLARVAESGARYIVMSLNAFTPQPFCDLPECFAGWMARSEPNSGEIFEARSVQDKVDIASNSRIAIPAIFDVVEKTVIWTDIALKTRAVYNNVGQNRGGISLMLCAFTSLRKTDLYTLFNLHIEARGERIEKVEEAQTVFAVNQGITPFDIPKIATEFM